jgi:hypothetical protein
MINTDRLNKIEMARHLLSEPGPEIVRELIVELRKAKDHLETAWGVIASAGVSPGDWSSMTPEWYEAARKWRDEWHKMICADPKETHSISTESNPAQSPELKLLHDAWIRATAERLSSSKQLDNIRNAYLPAENAFIRANNREMIAREAYVNEKAKQNEIES